VSDVTRHVIVHDSLADLQRAGADLIFHEAREAAKARGRFTIALSGGTTPRGLYERLAGDGPWRSGFPWAGTHVFWGDERHVPRDHPDSNARMAIEALLSKVPIPPEAIHPIAGEEPNAGRAAELYETTLRTRFGVTQGVPRFDLVLLGMGSDGHTASLFPGTEALQEERRLVVANWVGKLFTERITMTPSVLNEAELVIFLIAGADKALPLKGVLEGPYEPQQLPAQMVRPHHGRLVYLLDRAAAGLLKKEVLRDGGRLA